MRQNEHFLDLGWLGGEIMVRDDIWFVFLLKMFVTDSSGLEPVHVSKQII